MSTRTVRIQPIDPTHRVRTVELDDSTLVLREEHRRLAGGRAWVLQHASVIRRMASWPTAEVRT